MSARDWSTIGASARLPRWIPWAIPPLVIPPAAIAWIAAHWDRIPLRYATHFGSGGRPDGWTTRTPLHVYGVLIFAEGLAAILVGLVLAVWYGSRRPGQSSPLEKIPLAVLIPLLALGGIVNVIRAQSEPDDIPDDTPNECWSLSGVYYNPKDPALFVRARVGYGYTFNMANRWSYGLLIGLFGGIGLLVAFPIWSMR